VVKRTMSASGGGEKTPHRGPPKERKKKRKGEGKIRNPRICGYEKKKGWGKKRLRKKNTASKGRVVKRRSENLRFNKTPQGGEAGGKRDKNLWNIKNCMQVGSPRRSKKKGLVKKELKGGGEKREKGFQTIQTSHLVKNRKRVLGKKLQKTLGKGSWGGGHSSPRGSNFVLGPKDQEKK